MNDRQKYGKCIAIEDYYYHINDYKNQVYTKKLVFSKGDIFNFWLEDGWLYHIEGLQYPFQYALFDKYFEVLVDERRTTCYLTNA